MKHVTLTTMRNHRFRQAIHRARQDSAEKCISRLVDHVMAQPVERGFFVSADHVLVMDRRRREGKLPIMTSERSAMWAEIFTQMDEYRKKNKKSTITEAATYVVSHGRASRFYINRAVALSVVLEGLPARKSKNS